MFAQTQDLGQSRDVPDHELGPNISTSEFATMGMHRQMCACIYEFLAMVYIEYVLIIFKQWGVSVVFEDRE